MYPDPDDVREGIDCGDGTLGNLIVPAAEDLRADHYAGWKHIGAGSGGADTYEVTGTLATAEPAPVGRAQGTATVYDEHGQPAEGVAIELSQATKPAADTTGHIYTTGIRSEDSDENGIVRFDNLIVGAEYRVTRGNATGIVFTVPADVEEFPIGSFLGNDVAPRPTTVIG